MPTCGATMTPGSNRWRRLGLGAALIPGLVLVAACSGGGGAATGTTSTSSPSPSASISAPTTLGAASSTTAPPQTSGARTVLSPVGLNVRSQPSKTAPVLGTAAQGATLTVLSHTDTDGGWYQVKGATVTGYITDRPALSAAGQFKAYNSTTLQFSALYPKDWNANDTPPASASFQATAPPAISIVVTGAANPTLLPRGRSGYHQSHLEQVVVCGVTGDLVTFEAVAPPPTTAAPQARYLAQIHLTLDGQHAMGIDASFSDAAQLQVVRDFANSVSFPYPQCEQGTGPTPPPTASH